ncbi:MAG: Hpt domain-containing protein [Rhizobium sp.]|nr:Hpt domain-containing protein [Rhizobium sp.]
MAALSIAFEAPDNYRGYTSTHRPIDLVHLARQTSGDKTLELEVLNIFARQARTYMSDLSSGNAAAVAQTAHKLRGAALAVGAFDVSNAAEKVEANGDAADIMMLGNAIAAAEDFINTLSR